MHLAIALAYHGLLRVPLRAETSDVTPRESFGPAPRRMLISRP